MPTESASSIGFSRRPQQVRLCLGHVILVWDAVRLPQSRAGRLRHMLFVLSLLWMSLCVCCCTGKGTTNVIDQPVQILSKLFPQTATEKSLDEIREEQEKKDEEDRKEKEGSWKRMKLG